MSEKVEYGAFIESPRGVLHARVLCGDPKFEYNEQIAIITRDEYEKLKSFYERYKNYVAPIEREVFGKE